MTPEDAIRVLNQVQRQFVASGEQHIILSEAIKVLAEAVTPKAPAEKLEAPKK